MSTCPDCHALIPADDVNVAKDVAFCRACNKPYSLSALVHGAVVSSNVDLASPPAGTWYRDDGITVDMGASTRNVPAAIFFVFFATIWNGITWAIVGAAIFGAFSNNAAPSGAPATTTTTSVSPGGPVSILFFVPFIAVGIGTALGAFYFLIGKVRLEIRGSEGLVSSGIGPIAWRKRFNPAAIEAVSIEPAAWRQNNQVVYQIVLKGPGVKFGSNLPEARRDFLAAALRQQIARR